MRSTTSTRTLSSGLFLEVIDDYYHAGEAEELRAFALSCTFAPPFTGSWNGLQSIERAPQTPEVFRNLASRLPALGKDNWDQVETSYRFWGRPSAGMFALLLRGQSDTVHFHARSGTWAGVCYLAPPALCDGRDGVTFFRHKRTGAETFVDASSSQLAAFRLDAPDPTRWEVVHTVSMAFNRMVLFNGRFFHAASHGFGDGPTDGRLTQLFNIDFSSTGLAPTPG